MSTTTSLYNDLTSAFNNFSHTEQSKESLISQLNNNKTIVTNINDQIDQLNNEISALTAETSPDIELLNVKTTELANKYKELYTILIDISITKLNQIGNPIIDYSKYVEDESIEHWKTINSNIRKIDYGLTIDHKSKLQNAFILYTEALRVILDRNSVTLAKQTYMIQDKILYLFRFFDNITDDMKYINNLLKSITIGVVNDETSGGYNNQYFQIDYQIDLPNYTYIIFLKDKDTLEFVRETEHPSSSLLNNFSNMANDTKLRSFLVIFDSYELITQTQQDNLLDIFIDILNTNIVENTPNFQHIFRKNILSSDILTLLESYNPNSFHNNLISFSEKILISEQDTLESVFEVFNNDINNIIFILDTTIWYGINDSLNNDNDKLNIFYDLTLEFYNLTLPLEVWNSVSYTKFSDPFFSMEFNSDTRNSATFHIFQNSYIIDQNIIPNIITWVSIDISHWNSEEYIPIFSHKLFFDPDYTVQDLINKVQTNNQNIKNYVQQNDIFNVIYNYDSNLSSFYEFCLLNYPSFEFDSIDNVISWTDIIGHKLSTYNTSPFITDNRLTSIDYIYNSQNLFYDFKPTLSYYNFDTSTNVSSILNLVIPQFNNNHSISISFFIKQFFPGSNFTDFFKIDNNIVIRIKNTSIQFEFTYFNNNILLLNFPYTFGNNNDYYITFSKQFQKYSLFINGSQQTTSTDSYYKQGDYQKYFESGEIYIGSNFDINYNTSPSLTLGGILAEIQNLCISDIFLTNQQAIHLYNQYSDSLHYQNASINSIFPNIMDYIIDNYDSFSQNSLLLYTYTFLFNNNYNNPNYISDNSEKFNLFYNSILGSNLENDSNSFIWKTFINQKLSYFANQYTPPDTLTSIVDYVYNNTIQWHIHFVQNTFNIIHETNHYTIREPEDQIGYNSYMSAKLFSNSISTSPSYLQIHNSFTLDNQFTLSFWFKLFNDNFDSYKTINGSTIFKSGSFQLNIYTQESGFTYATQSPHALEIIYNDSSFIINDINVTDWKHFVVSKSISNHLFVYQNGILFNSFDINIESQTPIQYDSFAYIGMSTNSNLLNGFLDEFRISTIYLNQNDIIQLYNLYINTYSLFEYSTFDTMYNSITLENIATIFESDYK